MIGERVRLAREACMFTQAELAGSIGSPAGFVFDIESGRVLRPSDETIQRIASATSYPVRFFHLGALPDIPDGHYRRLKRGTSKSAKQLRAQVRQVVELIEKAEATVSLPVIRIKPLREQAEPLNIERIAIDVRKELGFDDREPIPNVIRALERAGVVVVRLPGAVIDRDGFSAWPSFGMGGRPLVALSGDRSGDRDRLTVAHELGHLILHSLRPSTPPDQAEKEAFRFASAFLLPYRAAREAMRAPITLRVLMSVKATYGTSIAMGAKRAADLGLVTRDQFVSFQKQISARRWRTHEPVDVPREMPVLIGRIVASLAGKGGSVLEQADRVALPVFAFRSLMAS